MSGMKLWLEIQEVIERIKVKDFQRLESTTAYTLRGVKSCTDFELIDNP